MEKYSMNFGKKERVLNYACQTYQLSRPNKVGAVMALIRDCQPVDVFDFRQRFDSGRFTQLVYLVCILHGFLQGLFRSCHEFIQCHFTAVLGRGIDMNNLALVFGIP